MIFVQSPGSLRRLCEFAGAVAGPHCLIGLLAFFLPLMGAGVAGAATAEPYQVVRRQAPFVPLPHPGGEPMRNLFASDRQQLGNAAPLKLPFTFRFFGQPYTDVVVSTSGYVSFGPWSLARDEGESHYGFAIENLDLPHVSERKDRNPNRLIALWWDNVDCRGRGTIRSQLLGAAPARVQVIEWRRCFPYDPLIIFGGEQPAAPIGLLNMQLWLREGSETIEVRYGEVEEGGPSNRHSATAGIASPISSSPLLVDGVSDFTCNPSCDASHWPEDTAIFYSPEANLSVVSLEGPSFGSAGLPLNVQVGLRNDGLRTAAQIGVRLWLSPTPHLDEDAILLHDAAPLRSLVYGEEETISFQTRLPADVQPGSYFLVAHLDPDDTIPERHDDDNFGASPIEVGPPRPEVRILDATAPSELHIGEKLSVRWIVENEGSALVVRAPFSMHLSRRGFGGLRGPALSQGTISLPAGSRLERTTSFDLPDEMGEGPYWVTIWIDPLGETLPSGSPVRSASAGPFSLAHPPLEVVTERLPPGEIGAPWCVLLEARGGGMERDWELAAGSSLPPGLLLRSNQEVGVTTLCGRPSKVGDFRFELEVRAGEQRTSRVFEVQILEGDLDLSLATFELPVARFGESYFTKLAAVGGRSPYLWSVGQETLPPGIRLEADGRLHGRSTAPGAFPFTIQVDDGEGRRATARLVLLVAKPPSLRCLDQAEWIFDLDEAVDESLTAAGGIAPYSWSSLLALKLDESGKGITPLPERHPSGLALDEGGGVRGIAQMQGLFFWKLEVQDAAGRRATCTRTIRVRESGRLTILTGKLAPALLGSPYSAQLEALGATGGIHWSVAKGSLLPTWLSLSDDGVLHGTPDQLDDAPTISFVVEASDGAGRYAVAPVSLDVHASAPLPDRQLPREGGCQGAPGAASSAVAALVAAMALWVLRLSRP